MFNNFYKNKNVLITGHTGFKGTWLTLWLFILGAKITGVSNSFYTKPSHFKSLNLKKRIKHLSLDISKIELLNKVIKKSNPEIIFHLAGQSMVKKSFLNPLETWKTNSLGTINILECLRKNNKKCSLIIITSDKSYKNLEIKRGYKETDLIGGEDPYSASKSSAELAIQSYFKSFLNKDKKIKLAVARAGNVVGGGDWTSDRLIPDAIKSWVVNKSLMVRNPKSTRPWQHVLDVLHGYLILGYLLSKNKKLNGEVFNFGPNYKKNYKVIDVLKIVKKIWPEIKWRINKNSFFYESKLLKLNSSKAFKILRWKTSLNLDMTLKFTIDWYRRFYKNPKKVFKISSDSIENYIKELKYYNLDR